MRKMLLSLMAIGLLTACSSLNESFDCAPGKGLGCQSVSAVNQAINAGQLAHLPDEVDLTPVTTKDQAGYALWIAPYTDEEGVFHEAVDDVLAGESA